MLPRDDRGMTLLEAVVALAILGLVGVAALATAGAELRATARGRTAIEAAALAEEQLARVALLSAEDLERLPDSVARGTFDAPLDNYTWQTTRVRSVEERDTYDVTVSIAWPNRGLYTVTTRFRRPPSP